MWGPDAFYKLAWSVLMLKIFLRISYILRGIEVNRIIRCYSEAWMLWAVIENIDILLACYMTFD
jgi:hypothetical protein